MEDMPVVMAVTLLVQDNTRTVGAAFCSPATRTIGACQFMDDDHFCQLEGLAVQVREGSREARTGDTLPPCTGWRPAQASAAVVASARASSSLW